MGTLGVTRTVTGSPPGTVTATAPTLLPARSDQCPGA